MKQKIKNYFIKKRQQKIEDLKLDEVNRQLLERNNQLLRRA